MIKSSRGGIRKDLGIYVRSSWEANYARYLNFLKKSGAILRWEFEPTEFEFTKINAGPGSICQTLVCGNTRLKIQRTMLK